MSNLFNELNNMPLFCIYLLKDGDNGYLQWSSGNAVNQLANTITVLKRGIHDNRLLQHAYNRGNLSLEILKVYDCAVEDIIIRMEATILFQKTGLLDMTGKYNDIEYRVIKRVMPDYDNYRYKVPLVYVTAKSRSVEAIVLGIFKTVYEADDWIALNYPGKVDTLIFMDNELTHKYHASNGYKLIRFREKLSLN